MEELNGIEACRCAPARVTERTEDQKKRLLHRLNRIEGQVRGVRKMIESDAYCTDVLTQSAAIAAAVNAFNRELLRAHVNGCVARDLRAGREDAADELISILEKLMR